MAARALGRDPETIRRWIRAGKLRAHKIGTQHMIEEADLAALNDGAEQAPLPSAWRKTWTGEPPADWLRAVRRSRQAH
jgi:excisionase family DNA binding protein